MIPSIRDARPWSALRPCLRRERFSHIPRACEVRFALRQRSPLQVGEVRRLTFDQELVEGVYTESADQFQADGEPHAREEVHRLVERPAPGVAERSVRSPELVLDNKSRLAQQ